MQLASALHTKAGARGAGAISAANRFVCHCLLKQYLTKINANCSCFILWGGGASVISCNNVRLRGGAFVLLRGTLGGPAVSGVGIGNSRAHPLVLGEPTDLWCSSLFKRTPTHSWQSWTHLTCFGMYCCWLLLHFLRSHFLRSHFIHHAWVFPFGRVIAGYGSPHPISVH